MATIDEAMLQPTWQDMHYFLDVLRAANGEAKKTLQYLLLIL